MNRIFLLLACLLTASTESAAVDTRYMQGIGDTRYVQLDSEQVGRPFHIFVRLPEGYDSSADERYPTIYVLDGGGLFPLFAAYYRYLKFGEEIPAAIIVGISYGADTLEEGNYRSTDYTAESVERDYWGGAATFQRFLSEELIPTIESTYRSQPTRRIIFGQSIGGQFVLYTALTRPMLFWGHIASNPALHRNLEFFMQYPANAASVGARSRLFVADGTGNDVKYRRPSQRWVKYWTARENIPWDLKTMDLPGHSHMSAPPAAFRQGLSWLFGIEIPPVSP
jgi:predicted alpha/beta superfamily hydrolase